MKNFSVFKGMVIGVYFLACPMYAMRTNPQYQLRIRNLAREEREYLARIRQLRQNNVEDLQNNPENNLENAEGHPPYMWQLRLPHSSRYAHYDPAFFSDASVQNQKQDSTR